MSSAAAVIARMSGLFPARLATPMKSTAVVNEQTVRIAASDSVSAGRLTRVLVEPNRILDEVMRDRRNAERRDTRDHLSGDRDAWEQGGSEHEERPVPEVPAVRERAERLQGRGAEEEVRTARRLMGAPDQRGHRREDRRGGGPSRKRRHT